MKYYLEEQKDREARKREQGEVFQIDGEWYREDIYSDDGYVPERDPWIIDLQGACPYCGDHTCTCHSHASHNQRG